MSNWLTPRASAHGVLSLSALHNGPTQRVARLPPFGCLALLDYNLKPCSSLTPYALSITQGTLTLTLTLTELLTLTLPLPLTLTLTQG